MTREGIDITSKSRGLGGRLMGRVGIIDSSKPMGDMTSVSA